VGTIVGLWSSVGTKPNATGFWPKGASIFSVFSLFDGRPVLTVPTPRGKEERFLSIGSIEGKFFAVIWTWREGALRIITARRARDAEEEQYRSLYGEAD
jgi:hypothetical protein